MTDTSHRSTDPSKVVFPTRTSRGAISHFPFRLSERKLLLGLLDVLMLNGSLLLIARLRLNMPLSWETIIGRPQWFVLLTALWLLLSPVFDAYSLKKASNLPESILCTTQSALLTVFIYLSIPYITPYLLRSRLTTGLFIVFALVFLSLGRTLYALTLAQPLFQRRALIVGAGWAGRTIAEALAEYGDGTYQVVGFVDDDPAKLGKVAWEPGSKGAAEQGSKGARENSTQQPGTPAPLLVLGDRHALPELIRQQRVTTLILAITHDVNGELLQILMDCLEMGVEIVPMPVLYEQLTGRVPVEHVGGNWYVAMPIHHPGTGALYPLLKRLLDIVLASLGLFFLLPFLPLIALAIYLDSPGPIFYTQERVGKKGKRYKVYKFRTMVPDAERDGAVWAQQNDRRVTRVGRILRRTHVDEFPQFLNILKGEMSAVGPRPERPEFVEELAREIPFYRVRHAVKPGMAGWGLVKQGYGASKEDALLKLQYDLYYIKHQSLWLDLVILLKTIVDAVTLRGR